MMAVDGLTKCTCGEPVRLLPGATAAENWAAHAAQSIDHDRQQEQG